MTDVIVIITSKDINIGGKSMSLYLGSLSTEKRETLIRDIYKYLKITEKDAFKVLQEYIQTNKALPPKYYIKINKKPKIIFSWKKAHERYYIKTRRNNPGFSYGDISRTIHP